MHIHQIMHGKNESNEKHIYGHQYTCRSHVAETIVDQEVMNMPSIGMKWGMAAIDTGNEHPKGIEKREYHDADGYDGA